MKLEMLEGLFSSVIVLGYNTTQPMMRRTLEIMAATKNVTFEELRLSMCITYLKSNHIIVADKDITFIKKLLRRGESIEDINKCTQEELNLYTKTEKNSAIFSEWYENTIVPIRNCKTKGKHKVHNKRRENTFA